MGFYEIYNKIKGTDFDRLLKEVTVQQADRVIGDNTVSETGFLNLLSPVSRGKDGAYGTEGTSPDLKEFWQSDRPVYTDVSFGLLYQ